MSMVGFNSDRYDFDKRLQKLQDEVLSLNYRTDNQNNNAQIYNNNPISPPTYIPAYNYMPQQPQYYYQQQESDDDEYESEEEEEVHPPVQTIQQSQKVQPEMKSQQSQRKLNSSGLGNQFLIEQQQKYHQQMLQQIEKQDQLKEKKLLEQIEQQNKAIQMISEKFNEEKQREEQIQRKIEEDKQRQLELDGLKKLLQKRQDIMIENLRHEIYDIFDQQNVYPSQQGGNPYDQNEFFFDLNHRRNQAPPFQMPPPITPPTGMIPPQGMMSPGMIPPQGMMSPLGMMPPPGMMPPSGVMPPPGMMMPPPGMMMPPPGMMPPGPPMMPPGINNLSQLSRAGMSSLNPQMGKYSQIDDLLNNLKKR